MNKYCVFTLLVLALVEARTQTHQDPFAALDQQLSQPLAFFWPWRELLQAVAAINDEDYIEEAQITDDSKRFEIKINVKGFEPEELRVKVENQHIVVEGQHETTAMDNRFMASHFVQRFNLPPGCKQEEVTAVLNERGVLIVSAPRHEVPPPPAERIVPIEVRLPQVLSEKPSMSPESPIKTSSEREEISSEKIESSSEATVSSETSSEKVETFSESSYEKASSESPLIELYLFDKSHVGKIRKELKNKAKHVKDNEVAKGANGNGLDYTLFKIEE